MRVLGIDPGSRFTGFGVVEQSGRRLVEVFSGRVSLTEKELPPRLQVIYRELSTIIQQYRPDVVAVEQVFVAKNPRAALTLGHARGAAICAAVNHNVDVVEYSALQIKKAVVGRGRAAKEQVQHMVRVLLDSQTGFSTDAADALACAICHIHSSALQNRLQTGSLST